MQEIISPQVFFLNMIGLCFGLFTEIYLYFFVCIESVFLVVILYFPIEVLCLGLTYISFS